MAIHTTIMGRLGHDPSIKTMNNGNSLTEMSVAVDVGYGDKKATEWFKVAAFGKTGEVCAKYLVKGSMAQFVGTQEIHRYTSKEGGPKFQLQLKVDHVQFAGGKSDGEGQPRQDAKASGEVYKGPPPSDDIPF
jgi:single-strand DNA-binding protein